MSEGAGQSRTGLKREPTNTAAVASEVGQGPAFHTFINFIKTKSNPGSPDEDR